MGKVLCRTGRWGGELRWDGGGGKRDKEIATPVLFSHIFPNISKDIAFHARYRKVVIPLRHPLKVAKRWAYRSGHKGHWSACWRAMSSLALDAFYFPWETQPFEALEAYLGQPVRRITERIGHKTPPDYELAESERKIVEEILATDPIARRFYAEETGIEAQA